MTLAGLASRKASGATRSMLGIASLACLSLSVAGSARAGDCNTDVAGLTQARQTYIEKLNVLAKASKGKLDPVASCPVLRDLVKAEGALLSYLQSNKNWCNVPDDAINNLKAADTKSQTFATQACNFAVQAKKQQQQAASAPTLGVESQKLPTGPL